MGAAESTEEQDHVGETKVEAKGFRPHENFKFQYQMATGIVNNCEPGGLAQRHGLLGYKIQAFKLPSRMREIMTPQGQITPSHPAHAHIKRYCGIRVPFLPELEEHKIIVREIRPLVMWFRNTGIQILPPQFEPRGSAQSMASLAAMNSMNGQPMHPSMTSLSAQQRAMLMGAGGIPPVQAEIVHGVPQTGAGIVQGHVRPTSPVTLAAPAPAPARGLADDRDPPDDALVEAQLAQWREEADLRNAVAASQEDEELARAMSASRREGDMDEEMQRAMSASRHEAEEMAELERALQTSREDMPSGARALSAQSTYSV